MIKPCDARLNKKIIYKFKKIYFLIIQPNLITNIIVIIFLKIKLHGKCILCKFFFFFFAKRYIIKYFKKLWQVLNF